MKITACDYGVNEMGAYRIELSCGRVFSVSFVPTSEKGDGDWEFYEYDEYLGYGPGTTAESALLNFLRKRKEFAIKNRNERNK